MRVTLYDDPITWTPASLGSKVVEWWDVSDDSTLIKTIAGSVLAANGETLERLAGKLNGYHLDQATGSARPTRTDNAVNTTRRGLYFDGGDMLASASMTMSSTAKAGMVLVYKVTTPATTQIIAELGAGTGILLHYILGANLWRGYCNGNVGASENTTAAIADTAAHYVLVEGDFSKASQEASVYIDGGARGGTQPLDNNNSGTYADNAFYLGARTGIALPSTMYFCEGIMLKDEMTGGEKTSLLSYLQAKWGTP